VRYLSLAKALVVAEAVTGLDLTTLARSPRIDLLDSALHAPQASFGGQDLYPEFIDKCAVHAVRIARNHPLIDGNKRLAWTCLVMFVMLNGHRLEVPADDAVSTMLAVAAGEVDEVGMAVWLAGRVDVVS
jgi:death-on-curing protein